MVLPIPVHIESVLFAASLNNTLAKLTSHFSHVSTEHRAQHHKGLTEQSKLDVHVTVEEKLKSLYNLIDLDKQIKTNLINFKSTNTDPILLCPLFDAKETVVREFNQAIADTQTKQKFFLNRKRLFTKLSDLNGKFNRKWVAKEIRHINSQFHWMGTVIKFNNPVSFPRCKFERDQGLKIQKDKFLSLGGLTILPNPEIWKEKTQTIFHDLQFFTADFGSKTKSKEDPFFVDFGFPLIPGMSSSELMHDVNAYIRAREFDEAALNKERRKLLRAYVREESSDESTAEIETPVLDSPEKFREQIEGLMETINKNKVFAAIRHFPISSVKVRKHSNFILYTFTLDSITIEIYYSKVHAILLDNYKKHMVYLASKDFVAKIEKNTTSQPKETLDQQLLIDNQEETTHL